MIPARERLGADEEPGPQINLGLVPGDDPTLSDRVA